MTCRARSHRRCNRRQSAAFCIASLVVFGSCQKQPQTTRETSQPATTGQTTVSEETGRHGSAHNAPPTSPPDLAPADTTAPQRAAAIRHSEGWSVASAPAVPFTFWSSHRGQVQPGAPTLLLFTLQPGVEASAVSTTVRGLKGVVVSGELQRDHEAVARGKKIRHPVHVRADKGVAGYVVVDVSWQSATSNGSTTVGVEIRAQGAQQKLEKLGRVLTDGEGQRAHLMKAQSR